jgi:predicted phage-related endonuclease
MPPKPQSIEDCKALFQKSCVGKSIEADPKTIALIQQFKTLEAQAQADEEQINSIKQQLMETMASTEVLTCFGKPIVTWKAPKPSYRIDTKRLSLEHPELIKAYQNPLQSSRRFVVKDLPEGLINNEHLTERFVLEGEVK